MGRILHQPTSEATTVLRSSRHVWVPAIAALTCVSGVAAVASAVGRAMPSRMETLVDIVPHQLVHLSRSAALLIGFFLIVSALNLYKRKRRAFELVLALSLASLLVQLLNGFRYGHSLASALLAVLLVARRRDFTVKSGVPSLSWSLAGVSVGLVLALVYGVAGFWFLERREFGVNFNVGDAFRETLQFLTFAGDPGLVARTHFARWFLDSLDLIAATAYIYAFAALFRPAYYRFRTRPRERLAAKKIVAQHGRTSLDFFKYWPDKSFYFSPSGQSVISYRVGNHFALALGDPVGPEDDLEPAIAAWGSFCEERDWKYGFHQAAPDILPVYRRLGFRSLKIGDEAIVELEKFTLDGKARRPLRNTLHRMHAMGIRYERYEPPVPDDILYGLSRVSDEWLTIPGRRERQFTLGAFDLDYVRSTPVAVAVDGVGQVLAFVNEVPSYRPGEATIDLMRRTTDAPDGVIDFLFVQQILRLREEGYRRFNLGMAPMSGFAEHEEARREERAIHYFFSNLNFLFSYNGLRHFKAKYATRWEPRYAIYRRVLDLPQMALALRAVSQVDDHGPA